MEFSVIIPCYKVEAYLPECLDSLLNQSFCDWEAIIVDDGSPDRCGEIADEYAQKDSRFKVVHQQNGGLSAARNTGISLAKGDFVLFLDSDDMLNPDALTILSDYISDDTDVISFGSEHFYSDEDGRLVANEAFNHCCRKKYQSGIEYLDYFVESRGWGPSAACFYCWRRDFLIREHLLFPVGLLHEDELFVPIALYRAICVITLPEILYRYRMREGSIGHSQSLRHAQDKLYIAKELSVNPGNKNWRRIIFNLSRNAVKDLRGKERFSAWLLMLNNASTIKDYYHCLEVLLI